MRNFLLVVITVFSATIVSAQQLAPSPNSTSASSPDVESLRQQVQALTETVKTLQRQVKDQQTTIDRVNQQNASATENVESSVAAAASPSPSPAASAPPTRFATEDASVFSST